MKEAEATDDKRLLLTGGTGFIGRFLVPKLVEAGWQVVVLSRQRTEAVTALLGAQVRPIQALEQWPFSQGPNACINLAGEGILDRRWSPDRKRKLRDSRIALTMQLVGWLNQQAHPVDVLISGSAVGFYGGARGHELLSEQEPAGGDFAASLCADWERAAQGINKQGVNKQDASLSGAHRSGSCIRSMVPCPVCCRRFD